MLRAAAVFSDHMVLQRNKIIRIFGQGVTGREIRVTLGEDRARTLCRQGKWTVCLPEREAQEGLVLEISDGEEKIRFTDVAVGEVWLAGGQSNMELELKDAEGGPALLREGDFRGYVFTIRPNRPVRERIWKRRNGAPAGNVLGNGTRPNGLQWVSFSRCSWPAGCRSRWGSSAATGAVLPQAAG